MEEQRFLLPFTHGVDVKALRNVLQLARIHNATVVALALIPLAEQQRVEDARLERILQAKDFLATLQTQGEIHSVAVEEHERYTYDVVESIRSNAQQMHCQRILLAYEGEEVRFLHTNEAQELLTSKPYPLSILYTSPEKKIRKSLFRAVTTQLAKSGMFLTKSMRGNVPRMLFVKNRM